jgi:hypothetical protein
VYLGEQAGFYKLVAGPAEDEASTTMFAANLIDPDESHIAPSDTLEIGGRPAEEASAFSAGVRREIWLYLLLAVIAVSLLEWVTYHRRITV